MQAIGAAVDNIHSLDENLAPLLIDLDKAHSTSGMFDPSYFELFKVSCLNGRNILLRSSSGNKFKLYTTIIF